MSKRVSSKENAQESFHLKKYVRIPHFKEIRQSAKLSCFSLTTCCNSKGFGVACVSKHVALKENAQESFLLKEYVRIPRYKEIQCCRVKTNMYVLEILKLYEKK